MDPSVQEKTSFVTGQGTYCYRVMPFGAEERRGHLPKVGEQDVPKSNQSIYGGIYSDMLVKSVKAELHITHLAEAF